MGGISQSLKLPNIGKKSCCLHYPTIYEMLPKFRNQTDMQVCLPKFGISAYFFFSEYIKHKVLTKICNAYKHVGTVQSQFSDTLFSDKSQFSDNFTEDHFFST